MGYFTSHPSPCPQKQAETSPGWLQEGLRPKGTGCGQCRTQGCVSLEAKRDWERAEWNLDQRDPGEKPPVQRSNLLAMPPTLNLLLGLPLA